MATDRCVSLESNTPLLVEAKYILLVEIRMDFDLVDDRLDFTASEQVHHHWNGAVADCDAFNQTLLDEGLHLLPKHMERR